MALGACHFHTHSLVLPVSLTDPPGLSAIRLQQMLTQVSPEKRETVGPKGEITELRASRRANPERLVIGHRHKTAALQAQTSAS